MDCAFANLDAAGFLQIWQHFDADDNGYIEGKELDDFFRHMLEKLGSKDKITEERVQQIKKSFMSAYDLTSDGRLAIHELANMILPEDENFLLIFRREAPLDNSVEFMKIWRKYDADSSGYISAVELKGFLNDLFQQHKKNIPHRKLDEYTNTMMSIFDKNKDGRLDLNDLASGLGLEGENESLCSKTGALEGPEVDGFVKDMMELVQPSIRGVDLDKLREVLLRHCDVNKDGKIQKSELALCLGVKIKSHAH
uniref:Secretagogin n=1 Tax=Sinocyclocheilus anshuiensis TaxID=1608454 RepID=A0A671MZJ9_9TELE